MGCLGFEPRTSRLKAEYSTAELTTLLSYPNILFECTGMCRQTTYTVISLVTASHHPIVHYRQICSIAGINGFRRDGSYIDLTTSDSYLTNGSYLAECRLEDFYVYSIYPARNLARGLLAISPNCRYFACCTSVVLVARICMASSSKFSIKRLVELPI